MINEQHFALVLLRCGDNTLMFNDVGFYLYRIE